MQMLRLGLDALPKVMEIVADAKAFLLKMTEHQWQHGYPDEERMARDILEGSLYGAYEGEDLLGIVCLSQGWNPDYETIRGGKCIIPHTDKDLVMHRIAVKASFRGKGVGAALFSYAEEVGKALGCPSLKFDTHRKNIPMQKLAERFSYAYAGIITLGRGEPDSERLLFEKAL